MKKILFLGLLGLVFTGCTGPISNHYYTKGEREFIKTVALEAYKTIDKKEQGKDAGSTK